MTIQQILDIGMKKAKQSGCRYKISAIGVNKKGEIIYKSTNKFRLPKKGSGLHAEMEVMKNCGKNLDTIYIVRVNKSGFMLPIDPCNMCRTKAEELGVKIVSLTKGIDNDIRRY